MADMPVRGHILFTVNASWNVVNFRSGLIRGLLADGYRVTVAAPRDRHSPAIEALGCVYRELPMENHGRSPLGDLALFARFIRLIRRERPDFFLGYTVKPNTYGTLAAALFGVPTVNNIAGLGLVFNETGATARIVRTLYRVALARSRRVFFQNAEDRAMFVDAGLVDAAVADLLPGSGVDLERFAPAPARAAPFTFLLVARLLWEKGLAEYVEAGRIVRERHPGCRVRLLGFIDDATPAGVPRARIEAWQAAGDIEYLGSAEDVRPHLAEADCVVLPSYYREGTPRTLLEAAAMAKPIITSDMPGCRDVVDHGRNGELVPPRDVPALAAAMGRMVEASPEARAAMGAASRAKAEAVYDERIVVARYLATLDEIGRAPRGRASG